MHHSNTLDTSVFEVMIRSCLGAVALSLLCATGASAQAGPGADVAVSYRYCGVTTFNSGVNEVPALTGLPRGFDVAVRAHVRPVVSVVGEFGTNWASVAIPTGGANPPDLVGTESYRLFDILGGVKFSRAGTSPFCQIVVGASVASVSCTNVSEAGQGFYVSHLLLAAGVVIALGKH
ncbi:MAG TPA: hypothetical protein VIX35_06610 [Vicinamibacterales bacterium]